jgi:hypothetical protein
MRKLSFLLAGILLITFFQSCKKVSGDGPVVIETRGVSGFKEIKSEFSGDVYITQGNHYNVSIEAQQNIIDVLETVLNDGRLTIRVKNNTSIRSSKRILVRITTPDISGIIVSGSGNTEVMEAFSTPYLYLKVSGSGNLNISKVTADNIDANISGSGEVNIYGGTVGNENLDISGSGSMDFLNLMASSAHVKISGSGDARVYATNELKVKISGSGNVYYKGSPGIDVSISGSGSLKRI